MHVFAEAGFADGLGADGDCYGFGVAAFAEVGCGICGWRLFVVSGGHFVLLILFLGLVLFLLFSVLLLIFDPARV